MNQVHYIQSWQGVGISSDPNIKPDPISLHMLAYLMHGSESSDQHTVVIGDSMQIHNYVVLFGMDPERAGEIAAKKGARKARDMRRLCSAYDLDNVSVVQFGDMQGDVERLIGSLSEIYEHDPEIQEAVLATIPKRLRRKTTEEGIHQLARYTIDEIAMALSMNGTRVSHPRQHAVDDLTARVHEKYCLGNQPNFEYPELGLEFDPGTGLSVEPYSGLQSEGRILLTDGLGAFVRKVQDLSNGKMRKLREQLETTWDQSLDNLTDFYNDVIDAGNWALTPFRNKLKLAVLATAAFTALMIPFAIIGEHTPPLYEQYKEMGSTAFIAKYGKIGMDLEVAFFFHERALEREASAEQQQDN